MSITVNPQTTLRILTASALLALGFTGASAGSLGVNLGGDTGLNASLDLGGGGIGAELSLGGSDGANASVGVGGDSLAGADASVGGTQGVNAGASVGGSSTLQAGLSVGGTSSGSPGTGGPSTVAPTIPGFAGQPVTLRDVDPRLIATARRARCANAGGSGAYVGYVAYDRNGVPLGIVHDARLSQNIGGAYVRLTTFPGNGSSSSHCVTISSADVSLGNGTLLINMGHDTLRAQLPG